MSYREGYGTLKLSEPTTLRDIALTLSYIPSEFKTPALEELRRLLREYGVKPRLRVECAWSTFIPKEEEYMKPDVTTLKRVLILNLSDAGWDYAVVNPELSLRLKKIHDALDKEKWDFETLNKEFTKWRYQDWKKEHAWDLSEEEMKQVEHPFKGLILGNPSNSRANNPSNPMERNWLEMQRKLDRLFLDGKISREEYERRRRILELERKRSASSKGNLNHVSESTFDKLSRLRSLALERLQSERRRITPQEWSELKLLMRELPPAFQDQIWRDVKTYNFYDALAMWLDPVSGLASYYPREFVEIGEKFLQISPTSAPPPLPKEIGVSGHIANYDVFIAGDSVTIIEDKPKGKVYKRVVKGLGAFVKKAGKNLRLGWAEFPDFEIVYIYNKAEDNFGYAVNLQVPEFSEWGYAPFTVESKPELKSVEEVRRDEAERHRREIKESDRRIQRVRVDEVSQASFQKLIYEELDKARRSPAWQRKLKTRFEQICDRVDWKRAIPTMTFHYYPDALEVAASIAWHHGGVDFEVLGPSEIRVWSKGYYHYTGGV